MTQGSELWKSRQPSMANTTLRQGRSGLRPYLRLIGCLRTGSGRALVAAPAGSRMGGHGWAGNRVDRVPGCRFRKSCLAIVSSARNRPTIRPAKCGFAVTPSYKSGSCDPRHLSNKRKMHSGGASERVATPSPRGRSALRLGSLGACPDHNS